MVGSVYTKVLLILAIDEAIQQYTAELFLTWLLEAEIFSLYKTINIIWTYLYKFPNSIKFLEADHRMEIIKMWRERESGKLLVMYSLAWGRLKTRIYWKWVILFSLSNAYNKQLNYINICKYLNLHHHNCNFNRKRGSSSTENLPLMLKGWSSWPHYEWKVGATCNIGADSDLERHILFSGSSYQRLPGFWHLLLGATHT